MVIIPEDEQEEVVVEAELATQFVLPNFYQQ